MPDYHEKIAALRRKAADPSVRGTPEAKILLDKADELEAKYGNSNSRFTDDTTVTSRDGFTYSNIWAYWQENPFPPPRDEAEYERRRREAERIAETLKNNQWMWNREYYDQHGNPRTPDEADLVEEGFEHDPEDEDAGYDVFTERNYDAE